MRKYYYAVFVFSAVIIASLTLLISIQNTPAGSKYAFLDTIQQGSISPGVMPEVSSPGNCMRTRGCCKDSCKMRCCKTECSKETGESGEVPVGRNPNLNSIDTTSTRISPPPVEVK